ncbi:MAG: Replication factor C large subunit [Candidatus Argoarchaeum ethanivorans]|uniref:Replication factor C large subunit n=1 Tax=Candidatus Argoarchaeum ethanivorans TaxID=2608793 RepID=A0A811T7F4_9EURY|nr:MAG: Replication factor C large subunit [Candidatus Argoarchaeum ethanivorans]
MSSEEWTEKYRPEHLDDLVGHKKPIEELKTWARYWQQDTPMERVVILYGKPGVGKTTSAYALARDFGWDLIELNASDSRTADVITRVAGSASQMGTFEGTHGKRLVVLDEADNIHGNADRGGANAVIKVIKNTHQPIILIANEYYGMSKTLRDSCKSINFAAVRTSTIESFIKKIASMEKIRIEPDAIKVLAAHSGGDMRSALNDFQAVAEGRDELVLEDIAVSPRDSKETVFQVIAKIFKGSDISEIYHSTFQLDETPENLIHWIDENLPIAYKHPHDLVNSFEVLSRADMFLGRVRRRQNYRMWKHASLLMSGGIAVSKTRKYEMFTRFQPPSTWRRLAQTKNMRNTRDAISLKVGRRCHVSKEFARAELIEFARLLIKDKRYAAIVAAELDLSIEEITYLLQSKTTSKKVKNIYGSARALIEKETEENIELFARTEQKSDDFKHGEDKVKVDVKTIRKEAKSSSTPQSTLFDF